MNECPFVSRQEVVRSIGIYGWRHSITGTFGEKFPWMGECCSSLESFRIGESINRFGWQMEEFVLAIGRMSTWPHD